MKPRIVCVMRGRNIKKFLSFVEIIFLKKIVATGNTIRVNRSLFRWLLRRWIRGKWITFIMKWLFFSALQCWYKIPRSYLYDDKFSNIHSEILLQVRKDETCTLSYRLFNGLPLFFVALTFRRLMSSIVDEPHR